jgi:hypothetical protein
MCDQAGIPICIWAAIPDSHSMIVTSNKIKVDLSVNYALIALLMKFLIRLSNPVTFILYIDGFTL